MTTTACAPPALAELLEELARPEAYPDPAPSVEVVQTHISVVFLAGEHVYKLKKPLDLGFLDYSTLARRRACCAAEVALNRRLAPGVYLGVVPVVRDGPRLRIGRRGEGPVVEWAVHMRRLPAAHTLLARLDGLEAPLLARLGARIARFHAAARGGPAVARWGRFEVVAGNCRENFEQLRPHVGLTLSPPVAAALERATEGELARLRPLIERRAAAGRPRETHGDLRLEHVYADPDRPDDEPLVVDCIEFNERFRHADPIADLAFLAMDLKREGRPDLVPPLVEAYFAAAGDEEGRLLLPLYVAYRATVRGKVQGMKAAEPEVPAAERARARARAQGFFLLALGELAPPGQRPGLVLVTGLPGCGKSTVSAGLAATGWTWIRSDVVRKELAGLAPGVRAAAGWGAGIYGADWTERTYAACLERARAVWWEGGRALVDATFSREAHRRAFLAAAREAGVPVVLVECRTSPALVRARLAARCGDPSDADLGTYERARAAREPAGPVTSRVTVSLDCDRGPEEVVAEARVALARAGLDACPQ